MYDNWTPNALEVQVQVCSSDGEDTGYVAYVQLPRFKGEWITVLRSLAESLAAAIMRGASASAMDTAILIELFPVETVAIGCTETVDVNGQIVTNRVVLTTPSPEGIERNYGPQR